MTRHDGDEPKDVDSGLKAGQLDGSAAVTAGNVPLVEPVKPSCETPAPPPHVGGTPSQKVAAPVEVEDDNAEVAGSKPLVPPNLHTTEAGSIKLETDCLAEH